MAGGTWNDALEKKFLLELLILGGSSAANMGVIAEKWGKPHTKGSLGIKLTRMKEKYAKEGNQEESTAEGTPKKGAEGKRKIGDDEGAGEDQDSEMETKSKKVKAPKAKKVKAEMDSD